MFSKLLLSAALSLLTFVAAAQEVPASAAPIEEATTTATSAATPDAPASAPSAVAGIGSWFGSKARSITDTAKAFVDGVKQGYSSKEQSAAKASTPALPVTSSTTVAPTTVTADDAKTDTVASRLIDLRAKLTELAVGRQAPAPVETRVIVPLAKADGESTTR